MMFIQITFHGKSDDLGAECVSVLESLESVFYFVRMLIYQSSGAKNGFLLMIENRHEILHLLNNIFDNRHFKITPHFI